MSDSAPTNPLSLDASRAAIRDTAKWVSAAAAAVATLAVGGSSFSLLGSLEVSARLVFAIGAAGLGAYCCWRVFAAAVDVLSLRMFTLDAMADGQEFRTVVASVDAILARENPAGLRSVIQVRDAYDDARQQYFQALARGDERETAQRRQTLQARMLRADEAKELCITQRLVERFERLMTTLKRKGAIAVGSLLAFAWAANPPKPAWSDIGKPYQVAIAWGVAQEHALMAAGMKPACMTKSHPLLLALGQSAGLRTRLLAVPADLDNDCKAVRVTVDTNGQLGADD